MFALGFLAAGLVIGRRLKELGKPLDWTYEIVFAALVGGVVGAKVYFVIEHGDLGSLFSGTGLVWYGGALCGVAQDAQRPAAGHLLRPAGAGLRNRPHRLSALRRRRLRDPVGRPVGDELP